MAGNSKLISALFFVAFLLIIGCRDTHCDNICLTRFRLAERMPNEIVYVDRPLSTAEKSILIQMFKKNEENYFIDGNGEIYLPCRDDGQDMQLVLWSMSDQLLDEIEKSKLKK